MSGVCNLRYRASRHQREVEGGVCRCYHSILVPQDYFQFTDQVDDQLERETGARHGVTERQNEIADEIEVSLSIP